jgi:hypothetical protein
MDPDRARLIGLVEQIHAHQDPGGMLGPRVIYFAGARERHL